MRKLITILLMTGISGMLYAQKANRIVPLSSLSDVQVHHKNQIPTFVPQGPAATTSNPVGTSATDAVTAVKIAEASNAYSTLVPEVNPISIYQGIGNSDIISFVHRQNINTCGGQSADNGRVRYVYSTDGGFSWEVGGGVNVSGGNSAPPGHCFGEMEITPQYTWPVRFPQGIIYLDNGGTTIDDLGLAHLGSFLTPGPGGQWDGAVSSTVSGVFSANPTLEQEDYLFTNVGHNTNTSFVERVPGEFWFVTSEAQGVDNDPGLGRVFVYKGIYDPTTKNVNWILVREILGDHYLQFDGTPRVTSPSIAFSPDGTTGYITWLGDLNGGEDSVYSPIIVESNDGGNTWSTPFEFNLNSFPEVRDSLQWLLVIDTTGGVNDTLPFATGKATVGFEMDMTVDALGNPHIFFTLGPASHINSPEAGYTIFSGLYLMDVNLTKDTLGDWNLMHIASQNTFRAYWGDLTQPSTNSANIIQDLHPQVSRSADGTKIFFAWTDTDTTNGWTSIPGPTGAPNMTNYLPDLHTRAYDLNKKRLTPVKNWTNDDLNWSGRVLLPKVAPVALDNGNQVYTLPTVIVNLDAGDATQPVSFYYFSDISISPSEYTEAPGFFYNCNLNPFANIINLTEPGCGASDGEISIVPGGGLGEYVYQWDVSSGGGIDSLSTGLSAGVYQVEVQDFWGCKDLQTIILNNANAPDVQNDPNLVTDISCNGLNDGAACMLVSGGTGAYSFLWDNGETDSCASMLQAGTHVLEVTDGANCKSFNWIDIQEPPVLELVGSTIKDLLCAGDAVGEITVIAAGGTGALAYSWSNQATGANISQLLAGEYTVTITDMNNCSVNETLTVSEPDSVANSFSVNDNTSPGPNFNGSIVANISGGVQPYTISWTGPGGFTSSSVFIFNLAPGDYVMTVTDDNNCQFIDTATVGGVMNLEDRFSDEFTSVNLYPNPSNGIIHLDLILAQPQSLNLQVTDIYGRIVWKKETHSSLQVKESIDLSHLSRGIYLMNIKSSHSTGSLRFLLD
ncbi:MAG: T9SS type A sorting domain-containing protein [Bacteroidetes bacterium]|nr:T9SS type A sorting domain-containing protein [Bacteroidota bacterium]